MIAGAWAACATAHVVTFLAVIPARAPLTVVAWVDEAEGT
jgi:hypothetical protein